jgi:hypothetical protein
MISIKYVQHAVSRRIHFAVFPVLSKINRHSPDRRTIAPCKFQR